jgi:2-oxoglutarate ferredoxin oxidoreductase subunit alpha
MKDPGQRSRLHILIGGEAGQGLVTVGSLLSRVLVRNGYRVVVTQSYQSRIRGGHNTFSVLAGNDDVIAPGGPVDILVALSEETVGFHRDELSERGIVLAAEKNGSGDDVALLRVPFEKLAGGERFVNTVALGLVSAMIGLDEDRAAEVLESVFGAKHPEVMEENLSALSAAYDWAKEKDGGDHRLPPVEMSSERVMLNGNEAIALGAVSAGARFCAFYPMTPSTSVPLTMIRIADRMGLVVEQAEDEIAAVNMAVGASYAGAPSLVATSGGGFALMVEGLSLAGMTETPLVLVIAQRPGPATGLPTRTEQADLDFALRAGHGEFPRAIFSPGTVEECFHLTRRAFDLAESYQSPVFVLTDQFLADSYRSVEPFDIEGLEEVTPGADPESVETPYQRHKITDSGVSPRLIPGASRHLVVTDSDEHTEDGHLTEDLEERIRQVDKRLKKGGGLFEEVAPPEVEGEENPDILLVSWGSTKGSVMKAARLLRDSGSRVRTLHFLQVWPLVPQKFMGELKAAKRVVCVEGNALGQFAGLVRRETGFEIGESVRRYDGLPITPEYILERIE